MPSLVSEPARRWRDRLPGWLRPCAAILLGTVFLALSSRVSIPMVPVPITLQTLAVVLVGAFYGWRLGGITLVAWLAEGAVGLPVFSSGSGGMAVFQGPTAGYIFAFPVAGMLAGWLVQRGWNGARPGRAFAAMVLAQGLCLVLGALWLARLAGASTAWHAGFLPFIVGALVKAALATIILVLWHARRARR